MEKKSIKGNRRLSLLDILTIVLVVVFIFSVLSAILWIKIADKNFDYFKDNIASNPLNSLIYWLMVPSMILMGISVVFQSIAIVISIVGKKNKFVLLNIKLANICIGFTRTLATLSIILVVVAYGIIGGDDDGKHWDWLWLVNVSLIIIPSTLLRMINIKTIDAAKVAKMVAKHPQYSPVEI